VPAAGAIGAPFYDATGDGSVAPGDALAVINDLNAFGARAVGDEAGEGEGAGAARLAQGNGDRNEGDWLALLAADVAESVEKVRKV
jgi:hypothetical protein